MKKRWLFLLFIIVCDYTTTRTWTSSSVHLLYAFSYITILIRWKTVNNLKKKNCRFLKLVSEIECYEHSTSEGCSGLQATSTVFLYCATPWTGPCGGVNIMSKNLIFKPWSLLWKHTDFLFLVPGENSCFGNLAVTSCTILCIHFISTSVVWADPYLRLSNGQEGVEVQGEQSNPRSSEHRVRAEPLRILTCYLLNYQRSCYLTALRQQQGLCSYLNTIRNTLPIQNRRQRAHSGSSVLSWLQIRLCVIALLSYGKHMTASCSAIVRMCTRRQRHRLHERNSWAGVQAKFLNKLITQS